MTARIIALAASLPRGLRARPWPAFLLTLAFAYGTGMWMQVMHAVEGGYERSEPPLLLHWLRDSTLSLPLVFTFVWLGLVATAAPRRAPRPGAVRPRARGPDLRRGLRARREHRHRDRRAAARRPLLRAPRRPRAGVRAAHGAGRPRRPRRQPADLPARHVRPRAPHPVVRSRAPHLATAGLPLRPRGPARSARPRPRRARRDLRCHERAARDRGTDPGAVVPRRRRGEALRRPAIDVDIPLNRFGDHDPQGRMYVLADQVDAVRAAGAQPQGLRSACATTPSSRS